MDEDRLINAIVDVLISYLNPECIILFGSRVKGRDSEYADFDIAVEGVDMDVRTERTVKEILDKKMIIYTVDLINLDKVDNEFRDLVYKTGKVLYERGSKVFARKTEEGF